MPEFMKKKKKLEFYVYYLSSQKLSFQAKSPTPPTKKKKELYSRTRNSSTVHNTRGLQTRVLLSFSFLFFSILKKQQTQKQSNTSAKQKQSKQENLYLAKNKNLIEEVDKNKDLIQNRTKFYYYIHFDYKTIMTRLLLKYTL